MTDEFIPHIDHDGDKPPFEQLREQVEQAIADGRLTTGTRLPAIRALAADLGIAPNTVARTYRELEQSGLVATGGRKGTVVRDAPDRRDAEAARAAAEFAARMRALDIETDDAIRLAQAALTAHAPHAGEAVRP